MRSLLCAILRRSCLAAALSAALLAGPAPAQRPELAGKAERAAGALPPDPFGRSTPSGTVAAYIDAISEEDYARASRFLDLSDIPASRRQRIGAAMAEQLQQRLDAAGTFLPRPRISDAPEGRLIDGLDPDLERVGTLSLADSEAAILLERKASDDGEAHWVISNETLDLVLSARKPAGTAPAEDWLPAALTNQEIAGAPVSHWLTLFAVTVSAFLLSWLLLRAALLLSCRFAARALRTRDFIKAISPPVALLMAVLAGSLSAPELGVSIVARQTLAWWFELAAWMAFGWLAWRVVDAAAAHMLDRLSRKGRLNATSIIRFAARLAKAVLFAITLMAILDTFGFNVTAAVAALGIGGIALALGAQKTVENLIASVSILSDRPFRIGDVCRFGSIVGTVEDIGMRSSRIRTLDRTLLTIPNSNLSNAEIENFSRRDRGWFHPMLHLSTGTRPAQLEALLPGLRAALADDRLENGSARVRLLAPTSDRLPIEVFGYIMTSDYDEYLQIQEELMLKLLGILADQGLALLPPALHVTGARPRLVETAEAA